MTTILRTLAIVTLLLLLSSSAARSPLTKAPILSQRSTSTVVPAPSPTLVPPAPRSTATPTPPLTPTPMPSPLPSLTPSPTPIPSLTPFSTPSPTPTPSLAPSSTPSPIAEPDPTFTLSPIATPIPQAPDDALDWLPIEPPTRPFDYIVVNPVPPHYVPNAARSFWVSNVVTGERREITARLRAQAEHVAMWVEEEAWHDVQALTEAASVFETQIYAATRETFGTEWTPGVDNDPRIAILHASDLGEGVVGYIAASDEFPNSVYPYSNQAEMMYVHTDGVEVGSPAYYAFLARQFQRLIQWYHDRNEEQWVKEGFAELAGRLSVSDPSGSEPAQVGFPDASLTAWGSSETADHRRAATLFATYFYERFGSEGTRMLVAEPLNGIAGFDATLRALQEDSGFEDFLAEWLVANYLDSEPNTDEPQHRYASLDIERPTQVVILESENYPVSLEASLEQFGADYILLRGETDVNVQFSGTANTHLLDLTPHSGRFFWWSSAADESLTSLTRAVDLSAVEQASLSYWIWYDLEPDFDYVSLEVSTDGGEQWQIIETPSGTGTDPHGNNPGWGYTGPSGDPPGWTQETVDLTAYAGEELLVKFAYLTDGADIRAGFVIDDIVIPEIDYADDVESGTNGWKAAGFVRTDNFVPQRYLALLINLHERITVERLLLDAGQVASWTIPLSGGEGHETVLVVAGMAPSTKHPASYQLTMQN